MGRRSGQVRAVRAAGVVPWRVAEGTLEVALVHRPRYDDWSWPKGKLDEGEDWASAAARETQEETGLRVRLGLPLPEAQYRLDSGGHKWVRYWAGTCIGGNGRLEHEVDEVAWLPVDRALRTLSYRRDRRQLKAVTQALAAGALEVRPLLVIRHAEAVGRKGWTGEDEGRPLNRPGTQRASRLVGLLEAYAPTTLLSSPALRCTDTLLPYAARHDLPVLTKVSLSEKGHVDRPTRTAKHLRGVLEGAEAAALCTHGPVLPELLDHLRERAEGRAAGRLRRLARSNLDKGEVLACYVAGTGPSARIVAVERHRPTRDVD